VPAVHGKIPRIRRINGLFERFVCFISIFIFLHLFLLVFLEPCVLMVGGSSVCLGPLLLLRCFYCCPNYADELKEKLLTELKLR